MIILAKESRGRMETQIIIDPRDLLPPDWQYYNYSLEKSMHPKILEIYGKLKEMFPDIWVNFLNGKKINNWAGLRSPACAVGTPNSYHKRGMALDLHMPQIKMHLLCDFCLSSEALEIGIKRVENYDFTLTWVHIDVGEPNPDKWKDKSKPYVFIP